MPALISWLGPTVGWYVAQCPEDGGVKRGRNVPRNTDNMHVWADAAPGQCIFCIGRDTIWVDRFQAGVHGRKHLLSGLRDIGRGQELPAPTTMGEAEEPWVHSRKLRRQRAAPTPAPGATRVPLVAQN